MSQTKSDTSVEQLRDIAVERIDDAKGRETTVNDVRGMTDITDFMIIASGTSDRHVNAIAERVAEGMRDVGLKPVGTEGQDDAEWIVLDYGDLVVHIMQQSVRDYYDLDGLWNEKVRKLIEQSREQKENAE